MTVSLRHNGVRVFPRDRITVPEEVVWWPAVSAWTHDGDGPVYDAVQTWLRMRPQIVAMDIETAGLDEGRWTVNCVTAAARFPDGEVHSVLLDPLRNSLHGALLRELCAHAGSLLFHNSPFDIPPLYQHGWLKYGDIDKVIDTIILARMLRTGAAGRRSLEDLATRYGLAYDSPIKIEQSMKAAGAKNKNVGYETIDIDRRFYRLGAQFDTIVTLRLWEPLLSDVLATHSPYINEKSFANTTLTIPQAVELVDNMMTNLRVTLRASARGMLLDRDYIADWREKHMPDRQAAAERVEKMRIIDPDAIRADIEAELAKQGPDGNADEIAAAAWESGGKQVVAGNGAHIIAYLESRGKLPADWARTEKGALKSDKKAMERLVAMGEEIAAAGTADSDLMLAADHATIARLDKTDTYFSQMEKSAYGTDRVHPQIGVLGASATGRMCLPEDYRLVTRRGVLAIDDVVPGDLTRGADGKWSEVTAVHRHVDAPTNVWLTASGLSLTSTPEHRWVIDDGDVRALTGSDIGTTRLRLGRGIDGLIVGATVGPTTDVWCVTTESGTFTAAHPDGAHILTGNSVTGPPLQQFSEDARPALVADPGRELWSVDWSSIEPVVLANCAGDRSFIEPFNRGEDLYLPVARAAGLIPLNLSDAEAMEHPGRKKAKVILLASMYNMGVATLAASLKCTIPEAHALQARMREAMAVTYGFMDQVTASCAANGNVVTIAGRVLDERIYGAAGMTGEIKDRTAVNHFCQGSAADILYATTVQLDKWGYGDAVHLWVHDELVCDGEYVEVVKEAMSTVPAWFAKAARIEPILRVDAQPMGRHWQKV